MQNQGGIIRKLIKIERILNRLQIQNEEKFSAHFYL